MKFGTKLSDLVPFAGNRTIVLEWSNFSNPFCFVMKRVFHRNSPNDDYWLDGLSHEMLSDILIEDLMDLKHVGEKRLESTLDELKRMFQSLEIELQNQTITLDVVKDELGIQNSPIEAAEPVEINDPIDDSETIEDLRLAIINYFDLYKPIDERAREIILSRHFAFGNQLITLEDLGQKFGITRERVRQIATSYEDLVLSSPRTTNQVMQSVLDFANQANTHIEFAILLKENGLTQQDDFSIVNAVALCEILQMEDLSEAFLAAHEAWETRYKKLDAHSKAVSRFRTKIGIVDIEFMSRELKLDEDDCKSAITRAYPRSIFSSKYALARTENLDSTFENIIYKQLLVADGIPPEDLVEGVRRHSVHRKAELSGENKDFSDLVTALAGNPPLLENLKRNTLEVVELSETDKWLLMCFETRERKMLHRSELVQLALEAGKNTATIGVYALFNPLLRPCGNSVYTVLGNTFPENEVRLYAEVVRKKFPDTEITYVFEQEDIILSVLPNMNALAGVIFPPKELYRIVQGTTFLPSCTCGRLESKQKIQFSVSNFWMGFSSIFKHAIDFHSWTVKFPISIALDFSSNCAILRSDFIKK